MIPQRAEPRAASPRPTQMRAQVRLVLRLARDRRQVTSYICGRRPASASARDVLEQGSRLRFAPHSRLSCVHRHARG